MLNLKDRLNKHFATAAVAVGVCALGAAQNAEAAIVHSGAVNILIPVNLDGVYVNVVTGATGTSAGSTAGWDINPFSATTLNLFFPTGSANQGAVVSLGASTTAPDNLPAGTLIDATRGFSPSGTAPAIDTALPWVLSSTDNIIGFRFLNEGTATVNFGWMRFGLGTSLTDPVRNIVEYAYENSGAGIEAGAVPAPGAAALLAVGSIGILRRRRK